MGILVQAMREFAHSIIVSVEPDMVIGRNNRPYMKRWFLLRNDHSQNQVGNNVYIHQFLRSDEESPHDHPWSNSSLVLHGRYSEWTPDGSFERSVGDIIERPASAIHAIQEVEPGTLTLFTTGVWERPWGFHTVKGFIPWREFKGRS